MTESPRCRAARKRAEQKAILVDGARTHHAEAAARGMFRHGYAHALGSSIKAIRAFPPHKREHRAFLVAMIFDVNPQAIVTLTGARRHK